MRARETDAEGRGPGHKRDAVLVENGTPRGKRRKKKPPVLRTYGVGWERWERTSYVGKVGGRCRGRGPRGPTRERKMTLSPDTEGVLRVLRKMFPTSYGEYPRVCVFLFDILYFTNVWKSDVTREEDEKLLVCESSPTPIF